MMAVNDTSSGLPTERVEDLSCSGLIIDDISYAEAGNRANLTQDGAPTTKRDIEDDDDDDEYKSDFEEEKGMLSPLSVHSPNPKYKSRSGLSSQELVSPKVLYRSNRSQAGTANGGARSKLNNDHTARSSSSLVTVNSVLTNPHNFGASVRRLQRTDESAK